MDFVTITDHNTLDGSFAIAHLPGTFLSTEFDTWFPENGCRVHVVALGIDEATFASALEARTSIYDLVACLREAGVLHYLAHPLFDMTGKLTEDVVEKLLLLFNVLEGRNGARVLRCNGLLREIAGSLTPERIADMAERQGIEPYGETPWRKALTGGSDDHSGLFVAGVHTEAECDGTVEGFLGAVAAGAGELAGEEGDARILANSIYASAFWRFREMLRLDEEQPRRRAVKLVRKGFGKIGRDVPVLDKTKRGVRNIVPGLYLDGDGRGPAWEELLDREIGTLVADPDGFSRRRLPRAQPAALRGLAAPRRRRREPAPAGARSNPARSLGSSAACRSTTRWAWCTSCSCRTSSRGASRAATAPRRSACAGYFLGGEPPLPKVAVFTDSWGETDGVSLGVRRLAETARARGVELEVITSTPAPTGRADGAVNFQALAARPSATDPGRVLAAPPVVDVLDYLEEHDFTAIHASTAGAMGLLAMLAAKLLHLPIAATFQPGLPGHAERLLPGQPPAAPLAALRDVVLRHDGRGLRAVARDRPRPRRARARPAARHRAARQDRSRARRAGAERRRSGRRGRHPRSPRRRLAAPRAGPCRTSAGARDRRPARGARRCYPRRPRRPRAAAGLAAPGRPPPGDATAPGRRRPPSGGPPRAGRHERLEAGAARGGTRAPRRSVLEPLRLRRAGHRPASRGQSASASSA